jgi:tRNA(Ile)-lysidine synthase
LINIQGKLDREVYVGCSGGVDSMAIVDFLSRKHKVNVVFFDHGNDFAKDEKEFVLDYFKNRDVKLHLGEITRDKLKGESQEEYWRNERYKFFKSFNTDIITCHHLNDCVETWIWSSLHGNGKIIPYRNENVIRPFRLTEKNDFLNWCRTKNVPWIEDSSNSDIKYMRNFIRHEIMPKALVVNPGLNKVVIKKVKEDGHY